MMDHFEEQDLDGDVDFDVLMALAKQTIVQVNAKLSAVDDKFARCIMFVEH